MFLEVTKTIQNDNTTLSSIRPKTLSWISRSNGYSYTVYVILLIGTIGMFIILAICVAYCLLKAESNDENPDNRALILETFEQIYDFFRRRAYQQALIEYQYRYELKRLQQQQQQQQQQASLKENDAEAKYSGHKRKKPIKNPDIDRWIRKQMNEAKMELMMDNKKRPVIQIKKPKLSKYVQSFIGDVASTAMRRKPNRPPRRVVPHPTPATPIDQLTVASDNQKSSIEYDDEDEKQHLQIKKPKSVYHNF
ncbi:uncharacterized protein LOC124494758 [Dermatophagoides farinae]|uniref:Uncharacterized protein n=1 Tax=Dermatophagoides farinae TaxID=6954 RepID=A0A922IES4_DERFA|nr:uncharacterized protein LOC124494758 [Dermatophagoides farinae]KAH7636719.1 hypothetical protein HUG17_6925 [Dermatophagoides farinae]KAH9527984.1 hypothetical protein DERF_001964 [Dermatophagoides farinae]